MRALARISCVAVLVGLTAGLSGCARPLLDYSAADIPALQLAVVGQPPVRDGRARFRTIFCGLAARESNSSLDCERLLVRFAAEPTATAPQQPLPSHDPRMRVLLVPGGFAECFEDAELYPEALPRLRLLGYQVAMVRVSGRSTSAFNAHRIAVAVANAPMDEGDRLVLFGYSKGIMDILEFLVRYPSLATRVHAVVSISGSVNGSPAADRYNFVYDALEDIPSRICPRGDRGVSEDLRRTPRLNWLAKHRLPGHIRYFSLGSLAPTEEIARAMFPMEGTLRQIDPLTDGQLLFYDQLVPGSELLGYVRSDHWGIALPLQDRWPVLAGNRAGVHFPRDLLFEALVLHTAEALRDGT
jgi:hypothetical protein